MNTKTLSLAFSATLMALSGFGQAGNTGGATGGGATGTIAPAGSGTALQGNPQTVRPQTINPNPVVPRNPSAFGIATNQFNAQNPITGNSNQFIPSPNSLLTQTNLQTGAVGTLPNPNALPQQQQNGAGPGVAGSNPSFPAALAQDRAINGNDRTLLVQVHRNLRGVFPSPTSLSAVHFQVQQGVVVASGSVQTMAQKQRILQLIQATPNVTQVVDQLQVTTPSSTPGLGYQTDQFGNRILAPTGGTNRFGINPNAVPILPAQAPTNTIR